MKKSVSVVASKLFRPRSSPLIGLALGCLVLLLCLAVSISFGAAEISLSKIFAALTFFDGSADNLIIRTVRVPRSLIIVFVGAALAVAGALMQGLTRNPLADPGILGIESGAALAVVVAVFFYGNFSANAYVGYALVGASATAVLVYLFGSLGRSGLTPLNLTLAGAAVTTLLSSLTTGLLIVNQRTLESTRFWLAGSVAGRDFSLFIQVLPYLIVGFVMAFLISGQISLLNLGEDVARGLGQQTAWVKAIAAISVVLLAGSSVAIAGSVGFIGLVVPHVARFSVGVDYRWILPYAAIGGAILLLIADIFARLLVAPEELPLSVMTAMVGAPLFVYLARSQVKE
ncbi:iron ABC transporter permease [Hydrococcus rivularis NIES-593]|uniref:Iron ABC transporter permease n=1 Tax=Hydrococcus rivularis NIES-593 TaxID=1921803 RepID=A0A1U7HBJ2_9CYAN|nr:iron ABC transporter permease [Hydrococcus rivularis]OKH20895.1 iron ABC transporter permease [Hydrococcus rivularis NIES-593]